MSSLEAKIVVLGAQGVGKTSLVMRYCHGAFNPAQITSTVGASFLTKRVVDSDTDTVVRLQIWDTGTRQKMSRHVSRIGLLISGLAGQERFRSISRLYYRGANACILCYSITDAKSFTEMGVWLQELRRNLPADIILHVVGTKADIVARDPSKREIPFERCIAYVAENLAPGMGGTPPPTATPLGLPGQHDGRAWNIMGSGAGAGLLASGQTTAGGEPKSPSSKRSSGFWGQEIGWDACHEISAESGEGVEEVFRVVTRKLVEQNRKMQQALLAATATPGVTPGMDGGYPGIDGSFGGVAGAGPAGYFEGANPRGSFRVGRDRRSWLFSPGFTPAVTIDQAGSVGARASEEDTRSKFLPRCC